MGCFQNKWFRQRVDLCWGRGGGGYSETKWNVSRTSGFEKGVIFARVGGRGGGGGGLFGNKMECFQNKRF